MTNIKAIGFDWGGVLVNSKPILPGIAQIIGITKDDLYNFYLQHNHKAGVESMSYADLWRFVLGELGHADKADEVIEFMNKQQTFELNPEMISLVDELRQNYKVGLLSNNTREAGARLRTEALDAHFDVFLISAEIGHQKPSAEAFQILIDQLAVKPEELVFIDDSTGSLSKAGEIGFTPLLFEGYDKLRNDLTQLGVIIS